MAFLQSSPPRQPMFRAPPIVMWLLALLVALHVARIIQPPVRSAFLLYEYGLIPARYTHAFLAAHPAPWWDRALPFVSHMGLHANVTHLALNCLLLLAFGPIVARRFGAPLFLLFFLVCGLASAGVGVAVSWNHTEPEVGASGAIAGLTAAAIRMLPAQIPWAMPGETKLAPVWSRQVLVFTLLWTVLAVFSGVAGVGFGVTGENLGDIRAHFVWQGHLGGFLAGLVLADLFDWLRPRPLARSLGEG